MTNEEAILEQAYRKGYYDARTRLMAIKALEAQDEDAISRQSAINVAYFSDYDIGVSLGDCKKVTDKVVKGLRQLPPITPMQSECEERKDGKCPYYAS